MQGSSQFTILEITILSAQHLKKKKPRFGAFSRRLRPFITVTATATYTANNAKNGKMYRTRVDEEGGVNPTWGDKFRLSLDRGFLYTGIYLQLYTKHFLMGRRQLGWCLIPAADIVNQSLPVGYTQFLSYKLRARDGSRGHGVVNVAVKLEGSLGIGRSSWMSSLNISNVPEMHGNEQLVIGIPVKM